MIPILRAALERPLCTVEDVVYFALVTNEISNESPRPPQSIWMVGRWSSGQQRCRNDRLVGAIESALRFNDASEIAAKSSVSIDLIALLFLTISLGHVLIYRSCPRWANVRSKALGHHVWFPVQLRYSRLFHFKEWGPLGTSVSIIKSCLRWAQCQQIITALVWLLSCFSMNKQRQLQVGVLRVLAH